MASWLRLCCYQKLLLPAYTQYVLGEAEVNHFFDHSRSKPLQLGDKQAAKNPFEFSFGFRASSSSF